MMEIMSRNLIQNNGKGLHYMLRPFHGGAKIIKQWNLSNIILTIRPQFFYILFNGRAFPTFWIFEIKIKVPILICIFIFSLRL